MDGRRRPGIRLTEEQHDRLRSEAERAGMTVQAFGQAAVLKAIEESEARRRRRRPEPAREATGLFGGDGLKAPPPRPVAAPPVAAPPIAREAVASLVEGVSEYVARGDAETRPARMATAVDVLRGAARDRGQLEAACRELDASVTAKLAGRAGPAPRSLTSQMLRGGG